MAFYGVLKGILLACIAGIATGFIPSAFRIDVADLVLTRNGPSFTHGDMTRGAILAVLADVLISNPNQNNENSTRDVMNLQNSGRLGVSSLIDTYYGSSEDLAAIRGQQGAYYSAERNGTEHLIPQNTYFAERIEMGPKQLPRLAVII